MQLDIRECLELRAAADFQNGDDELVDFYLDDNSVSEISIVVRPTDLNNKQRKLRLQLLQEFDITGIFDLGSPYLETGVNVILLSLRKKGTFSHRTVKIANWTGETYDRRMHHSLLGREGGLTLPEVFSESYSKHIRSIEAWCNAQALPTDGPDCEYVEIAASNLDDGHLQPRYYCKRARAIRKHLKRCTTRPLSDVAAILVSRGGPADPSLGIKRLTPASMRYPFEPGKLDDRHPTDLLLERGDIVFPLFGERNPYLLREETGEKISVPGGMAVIRCHEMLPEYLCMYLCSETGKLLREILGSGGTVNRITLKELGSMPVLSPDLPDENYVQIFEASHYKIADYSACYGLQAADSIKGQPSSVGEILDSELVSNMSTYKDEEMRKILGSDLRELNTCFSHGAYKATLILAGSILEAVLIDWLSEIKGRNFFDDNEVYYDGRGYEVKTLAGYISEIRYIARPKWMESEKAFEIKDKRNLVHAKLYIKEEDIGEDACRMVISYLEDVIRSRNKYARARR